jgi:signal transduction histidine kinase
VERGSNLPGELESHQREVDLVHRFAQWAPTAKSANDIAWQVLQSIRSQFAFDQGTVYIGRGLGPASARPIARFGGRLTPPEAADAPVSWCTASLTCADVELGTVEIARAAGTPFSAAEQRAVTALAQQAAIAIQNLRLQEESGKATAYRELNQQKTERLNSISHDLRGPLANIKAYAETLNDSGEALSAEERETFLQTIQEESDRLRDLLDGLLDLSRLEAGVMTIDREPLNLLLLVDRTIASFPPSIHHRQVVIPDDLFVLGDRRRLAQVLHNLVENAMKYSPQGGTVTITASGADDAVLIMVTDQGTGIPRHQWTKIFEPYHRAETTGQISGTGLGLAICKGIVEAHSGRIWVESTPGVGSTFSFTLPAAHVPLYDPADVGEPASERERISAMNRPMHGARSSHGKQDREGILHRGS